MRPIIGLATFTAVALSTLTAAPAPSWAAPVAMTLSSPTGPSGGGNVLLGTVNNVLAFPAGKYPTVQFQYNGPGSAGCRTSPQPNTQIAGDTSTLTSGVLTVDPAVVRRITGNKIAFTVPFSPYPALDVDGFPNPVNTDGLALLSGQATSKWFVCVYDGDSLQATSAYTLAARPQITAITPATGPTYGGQAITVSGSGFGAGTSATIDGLTVTDIRVASDGNSFTGTAPAHPAGTGYWLAVRTVGGLVRSSDPDNNVNTADAPIPFDFTDGTGVSPAGATTGDVTYLDVRGRGFQDLDFDQNADVLLVLGAYDPVYSPGIQECTNVIVITDSELLCDLDLSATAPNDYLLTVVDSGVAVADGAPFTVY